MLAAFSFYEDQREGLGEQFPDRVDFGIGRIQLAPERYPVVYRGLRRRLVERFPFAVYYRLYPGVVFIVAVMHAKRHPARWKERRHVTRSAR